MVTSKAVSLFENFNQITPYGVGFNRMFDQLSNYTNNNRASRGFLPYKIRQGGEYTYVIEMAVAGFGKKDIEVEVEDSTLTVRSVKENDKSDDDIYRGISYRKFDRKFTLADDIVVNSAELENGMLTITLERVVPEHKKPRLVEVK